jgi:hypothetical protein
MTLAGDGSEEVLGFSDIHLLPKGIYVCVEFFYFISYAQFAAVFNCRLISVFLIG